jgi:hypothetical protein
MVLLGHMKNASNDNEEDTFQQIGLHAALILNKFQNLVQTNGLGDAGPVDEAAKDNEVGRDEGAERRIDHKAENPRRASA